MSAATAGLKVRKNRPKDIPSIKYYVLREMLERRRISVNRFAEALGETVNIVKGTKGDFPMDKLDLCIELLNNWSGPRTGQVGLIKPGTSETVTKEMLLA
ncbi:MAG: hypothetical protein C0469_03415 [Cyanobacteria bacterium DS2.3.42]|nr:hypothetical protein [Cyanobacteria bacterium DS2.3.42]